MLYLHNQHFSNNHYINKWTKLKMLYKTPKGIDDDWYWLTGCLLNPKSFVITNDLMRDHHFTLLSQRRFLHWKERHSISFDFDYIQSKLKRYQNPKNILLNFPSTYSYRIQYDNNILYLPTDNIKIWLSIFYF